MIILIEFIVGIRRITIQRYNMWKTRFYDFLPFSSESVYFKPLNLLGTLSHSSEYNAHEKILKNTNTKSLYIYIYDSSPERN